MAHRRCDPTTPSLSSPTTSTHLPSLSFPFPCSLLYLPAENFQILVTKDGIGCPFCKATTTKGHEAHFAGRAAEKKAHSYLCGGVAPRLCSIGHRYSRPLHPPANCTIAPGPDYFICCCFSCMNENSKSVHRDLLMLILAAARQETPFPLPSLLRT